MKSFWKTLLFSVLIVNLVAGGGLIVYRLSLKKRLSEWTVKQVLERGRGELPSGFLAEALDLSQDKPLPWDLFDTGEAEKKLAHYPFFKRVKVRKIEPNAILVDYTLRTPVARVADFENRALDEEAVIFPLEPFYSPKKLPSVRFGKEIKKEEAFEAFKLLQAIKSVDNPPRVLLIDMAESQSTLFGRRRVVVILEERIVKTSSFQKQPVLLKLGPEYALDGIKRWQKLRPIILDASKAQECIKSKGIIVDLRESKMAYIQIH